MNILFVAPPLDSVRIYPDNIVVDFEDGVELSCISLGGPNNTFSWSFNNAHLENVNEDILRISSISILDAGEYSCRVNNNAGQGYATTMLFIRPRIISPPSNASARVNDDVQFTCIAEGFPAPTISWECLYCETPILLSESGMSSSDLTGDRVYNDAMNGTLELLSVVYSDYGQYRCVVSSTVGMMEFTVTSNATLSGRFFPYI